MVAQITKNIIGNRHIAIEAGTVNDLPAKLKLDFELRIHCYDFTAPNSNIKTQTTEVFSSVLTVPLTKEQLGSLLIDSYGFDDIMKQNALLEAVWNNFTIYKVSNKGSVDKTKTINFKAAKKSGNNAARYLTWTSKIDSCITFDRNHDTHETGGVAGEIVAFSITMGEPDLTVVTNRILEDEDSGLNLDSEKLNNLLV